MASLPGMKRIAAYCDRSEATVLQWIRTLEFPAAKLTGSWESDTELVDEWRKCQIRQKMKKNGHVKVKRW